LGSEICFDCGAKLVSSEKDPWSTREKTTIRKNTGEKTYARSQARQSRHESKHTAHSFSREADSDRERTAHRSPQHRETMERFVRPSGTSSNASASGKKKSKGAQFGPLLVVFLVVLLSMTRMFDSSSDSEPDTDDDYIAYSYSESYFNEDGNNVITWYDSNDVPMDELIMDYDTGHVLQETWYEDGEVSTTTYSEYNENGDLILQTDYNAWGELEQQTTYNYREGENGSWHSSTVTTDADGYPTAELFYDEDGKLVGSRYSDEGEVWYADGVDDQGNPLEED
jgi:hypothetical protein